ncbi:MAG: uroporphyrinogen-III C-methyltransferase [Betaproteobacteria bacterium]|nr:uroporphyrinogen-III C-methyltransferase [Betaproteobacteria bacterium]
MNEQSPSAEQNTSAAPAAAAPFAPHHNPVANVLARMSIMQLTLAVVLALFLWQWFDAHRQIGDMQQELARRLAEMEGNNKASQLLAAQGQEATRELAAKVALLEARYAETQNQRSALEALYQELSSSRDETVLAQVEQMLLIAGQQLQLSANVKAALIAMQQADEYLKRMDRAGLNSLRKTISRDMDKLRVLPNVDVAGINLRLDSLVAAVDALPLAQDIRLAQEPVAPAPAAPAGSSWQKLLHEIWEDARHLVRIENMQKQELPLLSPTQTFFLRENLKLRLLSARLALLARDEASFRHDLQAAQEWMARYFDARSTQGALALTTLQKLRGYSINIELPDVSASLEAVRNYRVSREAPREKQTR